MAPSLPSGDLKLAYDNDPNIVKVHDDGGPIKRGVLKYVHPSQGSPYRFGHFMHAPSDLRHKEVQDIEPKSSWSLWEWMRNHPLNTAHKDRPFPSHPQALRDLCAALHARWEEDQDAYFKDAVDAMGRLLNTLRIAKLPPDPLVKAYQQMYRGDDLEDEDVLGLLLRADAKFAELHRGSLAIDIPADDARRKLET